MPAITATATAVMVLTNVGLQFFNNWRSANTSEEMRKKQQEFQEAAQQSNHERMMQLLREGQALQEEMETQMHKERIKNINEDFDNLIKRVFHSAALGKWPLNVLPMVMKNQSLGSYRSNSNENIALHVIFTPSNCQNFNASVFPQIEQGLEVFMNRHWNTLSAHPVLFYSGAWKTQTAPTYNEIVQLQADLPHLPVLLITPFFKPDDGKLVFNIHMWGMGQSQDVVIKPTEQEFSYYNIYAPNMNYGEEIASTTIEEFVPYLQCMIGYLADIYFWSAHAVAPILPSLLTMGAINTDGMKYLLKTNEERYMQLMDNTEELVNQLSVSPNQLISLYEGTNVFYDQNTKLKKLGEIQKDVPIINEIYDITQDGIIKQKPVKVTIISPHDFDENLYRVQTIQQYNIIDTLEEFRSFIQKNKQLMPVNEPAIYIEIYKYSIFKFHIYSPDSKQIIIIPSGFDYCIKCNKLKHSKQIKSLCKYQEKYILICRLSRIDKLIQTINNNNLIY